MTDLPEFRRMVYHAFDQSDEMFMLRACWALFHECPETRLLSRNDYEDLCEFFDERMKALTPRP